MTRKTSNIIRYCNRPFQSVEAMNEALLVAWKETVGESDTIICGGDIALAGALKRERLARVQANFWYAGTTTSERTDVRPTREATQRG